MKKKMRPSFVVLISLSFLLTGSGIARAGTNVVHCVYTIDIQLTNSSEMCLTLDSPAGHPLVATVFDLYMENDELIPYLHGHMELYWTYSDGTHHTTILNSPDYTYCDGCKKEYTYTGYWYTFPNNAKVYLVFWENDSSTGNKWKVFFRIQPIVMHT